jgi:hypothetical protein
MTTAAQRSLTYYCQCRIRVVVADHSIQRGPWGLAIEAVNVEVDYCRAQVCRLSVVSRLLSLVSSGSLRLFFMLSNVPSALRG